MRSLESSEPELNSRRRHWRWSIRQLLVLLLVVSVPLAWVGAVYRDVQRRMTAANTLEAAGARINWGLAGIHPRWDELLVGKRQSVSVTSIYADAERVSLITAFCRWLVAFLS